MKEAACYRNETGVQLLITIFKESEQHYVRRKLLPHHYYSGWLVQCSYVWLK